MAERHITIPYSPRPLQKEFHDNRKRWNVVVTHRRFGKTCMLLNELIKQCILCDKDNPRLAYISPTYRQSKNIAWDYLKHYSAVIPGIKFNESELRADFPNGGRIQLLGADNPDSLRGIYLDGIALDEYAQIRENLFTEVIRPALSDRKGFAIFAGCVTDDTLILGESGLEEMGKCNIGYTKENKFLYGLGGFHKAEQRYGNYAGETIKIISSKGYKIEGTPNHRLWTPQGWKRLDQFKINDKLLIQCNQNVFGNKEEEEDFSYFLGLYLAEGSMEKRNYRITITNKDKDIHDFLINKYGFNTLDGIHYRKGCKKFFNRLNYYFKKKLAKYKILTKECLQLNKKCLSLLLRGYFDGDGWNCKTGKYIGCVTSSKVLSEQIHVLLLNFGIVSSLYSYVTQPTKKVKVASTGYRIEIYGEGAYRFMNEIGFMVNRKNNKPAHRSLGYYYWFNRNDFGRLKTEFSGLRRVKKISGNKLKKILSLFPNNKYNLDLVADSVKYIKKGFKETYDFVIPNTKQYFSNGFISHNTPKGKGHFYELYQKALEDDDWSVVLYKASKTGYVDEDELEAAKKIMTEDEYLQEFECSFEAAIKGTFYGDKVSKAKIENRICKVPIEDSLPVNTYWDIGFRDDTAIIFVQLFGKEIRIIDFYSNSGMTLSDYAKVLQDKGYNYGEHYFPWDAKIKPMSSGKSTMEVAMEYGINAKLTPSLKVLDGINQARLIFDRCWFNIDTTKDLVTALEMYRREYNDKLQTFRANPLHDVYSHAADSFRYLAISIEKETGTDDREYYRSMNQYITAEPEIKF